MKDAKPRHQLYSQKIITLISKTPFAVQNNLKHQEKQVKKNNLSYQV